MGRLKTVALGIVALVTCPCHLPLALALLGGTGIGASLSKNFWLAAGVLSLAFGLSLAALLRAARGSEKAGRP